MQENDTHSPFSFVDPFKTNLFSLGLLVAAKTK